MAAPPADMIGGVCEPGNPRSSATTACRTLPRLARWERSAFMQDPRDARQRTEIENLFSYWNQAAAIVPGSRSCEADAARILGVSGQKQSARLPQETRVIAAIHLERGMQVAGNGRARRHSAVAVDHEPAAELNPLIVNRDARRWLNRQSVVVSGHQLKPADVPLLKPRLKLGRQIRSKHIFHEIARDDQAIEPEACQNMAKWRKRDIERGVRRCVAAALTCRVVAEVEIGHDRCRGRYVNRHALGS
jgi:hypothetical protein